MNLDVVIVTHNSALHLPDVLSALPDDVNVFVVDNASEDESADVAERLEATVVRSAINAGFAAGCNRGAALGHAKTILFLNPDAVIGEQALETLLAAMDDDAQIGVASPRLIHPDGVKQRVQWPYPTATGAWREALGLHDIVDEAPEGFVIGAVFAVRREAFEAVGGFDERFWLYGEEADLCKRIEDLGWLVRRFPAAAATHVGGASGGASPGENPLIFEHFQRGGEHFVAKHGGRGALVSYRTANLVGSLGRGLFGIGRRSTEHRLRARRLARTAVESPLSVPFDSPASSTVGRGLVVCSHEAWDTVWRRNQFFVRELLEADPDLRVLFVSRPIDIVHELRSGNNRRHERGLRPVDEDGRIYRFEPVKWLPRRLGTAADRWRDHQVLNAVRDLGFTHPRLWVNDPSYATLADAVDWPAVYDITDDWLLVGSPRNREQVRENERRLFARCEAVTVCSPGLVESKSAQRDDLVLIPNGVDADELQRPRLRPDDLPEGSTAVYVGTLHTDRLDVDLTTQLAQELADVSVVLVGPDALDESSRHRLDSAGVLRLGPRPYSEIPGYLQHANVLMVPHLVSPFTESLDPIKAYECLAVGTPTIATPVAGFRDLGEPIHIAPPETFVESVRTLIDEHPDSHPQHVPTWSERATMFGESLDRAARLNAQDQSKMQVVFFDHCAQLSGGELALARMLPALREDIDPLVILGEQGPLEEVLAERVIPHEVLELDAELARTNRYEVSAKATGLKTMLATAKATWELRRRLRELQPDLLHTNSLKADLIGGVAGRLAGVPVIWHVRDRMADDYLPNSAIRLVKGAARVLPTSIIANSETTKAALGIPEATVVNSPVELPEQPRAGRDSNGPLRIAMVGRLAPWKGQDVFLRAFAEAFDGGQETAALAGSAQFGEDDFADSLEDLAIQLGIADRIEFAGHVDDVNSVLRCADVLVHASTVPEPFGQVVVEGMGAGLAVIAADAGGPAEVIADGVDGLLTEPGDVSALANALRRVADDDDLRERLGTAAVTRAGDFVPERIAEQLNGVCRAALAKRR